MKRNGTTRSEVSVLLPHGSVFTMLGACQKDWKHSILRGSTAPDGSFEKWNGVRLNLTFRNQFDAERWSFVIFITCRFLKVEFELDFVEYLTDIFTWLKFCSWIPTLVHFSDLCHVFASIFFVFWICFSDCFTATYCQFWDCFTISQYNKTNSFFSF